MYQTQFFFIKVV